jgi:hypothetical protein
VPKRWSEAILGWLEKEAGTAALLAQSVSLAVRIEPELLRAIRLRLHPELTVEAESAVWFSPLVEARNPLGFVFRQEALPLLRAALKQDPQRLQRSWEISSMQHRGISPAVALEERLTWRALTEPPPGPFWDDWRRDVEQDLQSVLAGLVRQNRAGLATWAARALPRLPPMPVHADLLEDLAHAAMLRGTPPIALAGRPVSGLAKAWVAPRSGLARVAVEFTSYSYAGSQLVQGKLRFFYPAPPDTQVGIEVPPGPAVRLTLRWNDPQPRQETLTIEQRRLSEFALHARQVAIANESGQEFHFAAQSKTIQSWTVYLTQLSPDDSELCNLVFARLQAEGLHVELASIHATGKIQARDFYVAIGANKPQPQWPGMRDCMAASQAVIWCQTKPSPDATLTSVDYLGPISFVDRDTWTTSVGQLLTMMLQGPPPLARLEGVPELPENYLPRPNLQGEIVDALNRTDTPMVALQGGPGAGQAIVAAAVAHDCTIRRRFAAGGVYWPHSEDSWPGTAPQLVIVDAPLREHYEALATTARSDSAKGSRILVIRAIVDELDPSVTARVQVPYLTRDKIREALNELPNLGLDRDVIGLIERITEGWPKRVSSLQKMFAGLALSPQGIKVAADLVGRLWSAGVEELAKAREWMDDADTLFRLAVFKPETQVTWNAWNLTAPYGPPTETSPRPGPGQGHLLQILEQAKLLTRPDRETFQLDSRIPTVLSGTRIASQLESHLMNSYEDKWDGDWVLGLGDLYFARALSYHLARTGRQSTLLDLLSDFGFIEIRLKLEGRPGLIGDLNRLVSAPPWVDQFRSYLSRGTDPDPVFISSDLGSSPEMLQLGQRSARRQLLVAGRPFASVLVAGTGSYELPQAVLWMAECVGRELARKGFGLITGGWQGVDYVSADAYVVELSRMGAPQEVLIQIVDSNSTPDYPGGTTHFATTDSITEAVERSQAVVLLGGVGGTGLVGQQALWLQRPIWAPGGTEGDAADPRWRNSAFDGPIDSRRQAVQLARSLVESIESSFSTGLPNPHQVRMA